MEKTKDGEKRPRLNDGPRDVISRKMRAHRYIQKGKKKVEDDRRDEGKVNSSGGGAKANLGVELTNAVEQF